MSFLKKSDEEIIKIANPIWANLVKSSNIKDYGGFTKDFSSQMLYGANEVELGKQWASNELISNLSEDYKKLGLSSNEIKSHLYKLYSFPVLISIMATIGAILILSFSYKRSKFFNLSLGVMSSVVIYYINYLFNLLGITEKTSIILAVCSPLIILVLFSFILLVRINEK